MKVADRALAVLQGRRGFDKWWDSIDEITRAEIRAALTDAVVQPKGRCVCPVCDGAGLLSEERFTEAVKRAVWPGGER